MLLYHPDKIGPEKLKESDKEIWLKVQNAYETLIDPVRRRKYDSSLPFNDHIPTDENTEITDENFYETYDPVFKRNSMFSKKSPLPRFGNADSKIEDVLKFYKFWDNF